MQTWVLILVENETPGCVITSDQKIIVKYCNNNENWVNPKQEQKALKILEGGNFTWQQRKKMQ